jgi:hypothetical protein
MYVLALGRPYLYKLTHVLCVPVRRLSLCVCLCLWVRLTGWGGPHASLGDNSIGDEGAKHVGAGLAQCPNLTEI